VRILILHSRYLSGHASGENRVAEDEAALLRDAVHDVTLLSVSPGAEMGAAALVRTGARAVWSQQAARSVARTVRDEGIEVVHCHNLFPSWSPSVLPAARRAGAAAVMTLHNYRLLCLPATFLRDGTTCECCLGKVPWRGVRYRCYRDSLPGSAVLAASLTLGRTRRAFDGVTFVAVSDFVRRKHVAAGFGVSGIRVKPNFVHDGPRREGAGDDFLYLGRLAPEKDLGMLVEAWRPHLGRLLVVGDGPDRAQLEAAGRNRPIEFVGAVEPREALQLLARARALVFPSRSYEGMPRAVVEAYAAGVPVLASDVGALPELVDDGETGLLVPPRTESWTKALEQLASAGESERLGAGARRRWEQTYSPERNLAALVEIYADALDARRAAGG
jgi:glycosyltransferase involved in cell wall biosynthesis